MKEQDLQVMWSEIIWQGKLGSPRAIIKAFVEAQNI